MTKPDAFVIQTWGLSKSFEQMQAVNGLDLAVPPHAIVGFLGPNGSGKSTTIKLLLGLMRPTAGGGTVFGLDINRDSPEIRRRVGYLAQDPRFYNTWTARDVLRFTAGLFFEGPEAEIEVRVQQVLELVGLESRADRAVGGFSGGERQRLGLAQAQVNFPDLLILDEPAAPLDPQGRRDVLEIMERLREHTTIFYSTHILDDVQRVSDRVVILNQGELVAQGPIEALMQGGDETVVFRLETLGDLGTTPAMLEAAPWVAGLQVQQVNGHHHWRVQVADEGAADEQLLRRLLANQQLKVLAYGRERFELEDVFLRLVEGGKDS